jgi:type II secretory pathway component GspD/PulD (secretin)
MIKPITTLALCVISLSVFAQTQTVKIKSRGEDIRTVIDTIFEQTGKQYVLETNYHQTLYMNLDGITFQKAIEIISNVSDMVFEEKQGIWYIHKRPITSGHSFDPNVKAPAMVPATNVSKPVTTKIPVKTNAPAKSTTIKSTTVKSTTVKPTRNTQIQKPATPKTETAGQGFTSMMPINAKPSTLNTNARVTVQLKRMDIREVFAEFGRQTNIEIEFDEAVPNYKLDASFYNTTLKFALDKVCKVAHLKFSITPNNTIRISKA